MNNEKWKREGGGAVKRFFVIFSGATPQLKISVSARSVSNQEFKNWQDLSLFGQFFRKQCKEKSSQGMDWIWQGCLVSKRPDFCLHGLFGSPWSPRSSRR